MSTRIPPAFLACIAAQGTAYAWLRQNPLARRLWNAAIEAAACHVEGLGFSDGGLRLELQVPPENDSEGTTDAAP